MQIKKILKLDFDHHRIFGLDLLRALAILIVLLVHSSTLVPSYISNFYHYINIDGVCIFFVLSGFLIGNVLIKTAEKFGFNYKELVNFWVRRWARTLPNFYLFLVLLTILNFFFTKGFPLKVVPQYLIFSQNLVKGSPGFFGEAWSLSVEEWFYIITPICLFLIIKLLKTSVKTSILIISVTIILFSILLRIILNPNPILLEMGDYDRIVIMRMDSIMYGVFGAYISFYFQNIWKKYKKIAFVLGLLITIIIKLISLKFVYTERWFFTNYFYPILCIGILLLLPLLSEYKIKKHTHFTKIITTISLISYSLYLSHNSLIRKMFLENIFQNFFGSNELVIVLLKNIIYWGGSIFLSILIYKYYESPLMKLRDKIKFK